MDLLDSIMSKMDRPPNVNDKHKKLIKEQQKAFEEAKSKERQRLHEFRKLIEEKINKFIQSPEDKNKFDPMDRVERSILRDVADIAGLTSYAFGTEEVDRHMMVFKKEYIINEDELYHYRNDLEWDPVKSKEMAEQREIQKLEDNERLRKLKKEPTSTTFIEKIDRLVGKETGKESARIVEANDQFGLVRSELKKDKRTIEEALADIRAKKLKRENSEILPDTSAGGGD